jgi:hypothetical protein
MQLNKLNTKGEITMVRNIKTLLALVVLAFRVGPS